MTDMDEIEIPIYLMAGFLESGKTSFLQFTMEQDYFQIDGLTLLILCEEGIEEYNARELQKYNTRIEVIEKPEDFTPQRLEAMNSAYEPERVVIEYNGMWQVSKLEETQLPAGWGIVQHITTVDAGTFQLYVGNMQSLFMEMIRNADMVLFNRCEEGQPLPAFRRNVKVVNQKCELIFEDEEGEIEDIFDGEMPFDLEADIIEIEPEDFGIWFIDAADHPNEYKGKTVRFTGMVLKNREFPAKVFVPGRMAMTCCADDTTFIGYICKSAYASKLKNGDWVKVTASIDFEYMDEYHGKGPVLCASDVEKTEAPQEEFVYFN